MTRDPASHAQFVASDPTASTWLAANAGSGKTKVLIDRVARLLLRHVSPQRILCLTYTKAAATEMQIRLFKRLGEWAMLPEDQLRRNLADLGSDAGIAASDLADARRLFARALETPGGLKIQTIHSFCAGLLRRFPLEAGVSPQFVEMDDRSARLLRDEVLSEMAQGPHLAQIDAMARLTSAEDLDGLAAAVAGNREYFTKGMTRNRALQLAGLPPDYTAQDCIRLGIDGSDKALLQAVARVIAPLNPTMASLAALLKTIDVEAPSPEMMEALFKALLLKDDRQPKFKSVPTKAAAAALGPLLPEFHDFMQRIADVKEAQLALGAAEKTLALHGFAAAFLPDYAARKLARGWLDFDDLILKARDLLGDHARAQWVLFRLDGGIDHILVDEAQDTGPAQWKVIERLAEEFHVGQGARDTPRTIFVVGDKKQSIYSFQGADLQAFDAMRSHFEARLNNVQVPLATLALTHSFRSSPAILHLVDQTLNGVEGLGEEPLHQAFYPTQPGRIDLWDVTEPAELAEAPAWHDPVDTIARTDAVALLAEELAHTIAGMIDGTTLIRTKGQVRALHAGDIIILVQKRSALFHQVIRACKALGLPIAGADRLKLAAELAVRDLTALMAFLALPDDDLSLAGALRSPLLGMTEAELYDVAQPRQKAGLWQALRGCANRHPQVLEMLHDLRNQADFLRPYELTERILTRHNGRQKLLARLGPEAEDGIDAFLQQTLAYERMDVPSLTGFLAWLAADELQIKRQSDASGQRIRVMTVHGAKGLEAPVIIIPDANAGPRSDKDSLLIDRDEQAVVWNTGKESPGDIAALRDAREQANQQERMRLLYVALTRAESWLIVAASPKARTQTNKLLWHELVEQGFMQAAYVPGMALASFENRLGRVRRLSWGDWPSHPAAGAAVQPAPALAVPDLPLWATTPARPASDRLLALSPSGLGGAKALAGDPFASDEAAGKLYGGRLHLLLEHLPTWTVADRPALARALLAGQAEPATGDQTDALLAEALAILANPSLHWLFGPDTLAEVGISASLPDLGGRRVLGAIDRLVVEPDRVLAVDYKSNLMVPDSADQVPDGLLRQMGAYAAALAQIYPARRIETAILWTRSGVLMPLPHDLVMAAMRSTPLT